ncbi:MAG TPA: sulfatase, partial [Rhodobacteraceae bacterium]|nr:sulfatase [Paracoccaceae bacterium]
RSCRNGTPLDDRHTNIAREVRAAGYDPVLLGYTDTSLDPRVTDEETLLRSGYEGVLPGFRAEVLLTESLEPWLADLEAKGYDIPENPRDIYRPVPGYPGAEGKGRSFAPPVYSAEDSETAFLTRKAMEYIKEQQRRGRNWFVHLSYLRPHPPFIAPEPYNRMYDADDIAAPVRAATLAQEAAAHPWLAAALGEHGDWLDRWLRPGDNPAGYDREIRQIRATYYGLITKVDHYLGQLLDWLKSTGQYDQTLIIITSDHGELLGDHWLFGKRGYFDQGFHIPLFIRDPSPAARAGDGRTVSAFTESVDLMPTMLDWLQLDIPRQCDGASLRPFLAGATPEKWRREVHWEYDFREIDEPGAEQQMGLDMDESAMNIIGDEDYKYVHFTALPPLLFDRRADPHDFNNLAENPAFAGIMLRYAQKMLSWRMRHDERILTGMKVTRNGVVQR